MRLRKLLRWGRKKPGDRISIRDYPYHARSRDIEISPGGLVISRLLGRDHAKFALLCEEMKKDRIFFEHFLERKSALDPHTPVWINGWLPPLDGMLLYTLTRLHKPRIYLEIGSGNSTKFVRQAIIDHQLQTRIVSIDPHPRAEIDALCDEIIRRPFEDIAMDVLSYLGPGDILFQDSSHRAFMNSDATIFFTEFFPSIPPGVLVGVHDIFLPYDYPEIWKARWYNEQYLLMTYLLGGGGLTEMVFPAHFACKDARLSPLIKDLYDLPALTNRDPGGGAFWMIIATRQREPLS